jgi:hypothetical protein
MKTLIKFSLFFALLLLCSGVFAQGCKLKINDANNGGNQTYYYVVGLYDFSVSTTVPIEVHSATIPWAYSGAENYILFSTNFDPDKKGLYFRAYARNTSNLRSDQDWSAEFDSGEYYNGVPITLDIP